MKNGILTNLFDEKSKTFSSDFLKLTAVFTMLLDHIGEGLINPLISAADPDSSLCSLLQILYFLLRLTGRMAFPIFAFLLVESFFYTKSRLKYAGNLLFFALISELPFDFLFRGAVDFSHQNIFWTLLIGLLCIWAVNSILQSNLRTTFKGLLAGGIALAGLLSASFMKTDYGWMGILLILSLYFFRKQKAFQCILAFILFFVSLSMNARPYFTNLNDLILYMSDTQWTLIPAFFLIWKCNSKRYIKKGKYLFYAFYPLHLLILFLIK